jgi:hypothetical protein
MKKAIMFVMSAAGVLATSSVQAALNLVQDPGFEGGETGTLGFSSTPWFSPPASNIVVAINSSNPHAGSFNAALTSQTGGNAYLFQNLTLTPGIGYTINFWLSTPGEGGTLAVDLNGATAGSLAVSAGSVYTEYNLTATAVNSSGILEFIWSSSTPPATLDIDDVSVAVPEPTTMVAGALMLLPFAAGKLRLRKKVSP